jgi:hypothetical protein
VPDTAALRQLAERWAGARPHERGSAQLYVSHLCEALGVAEPGVRGSGYEFELTIDTITVERLQSDNFIDLRKAGHFALEAKDASKAGSNDLLPRRASRQVRNYIAHAGRAAFLHHGVRRRANARPLGSAERELRRLRGASTDLPTLREKPDDIALLRDVWVNPKARDPHARTQAVTTDIAAAATRTRWGCASATSPSASTRTSRTARASGLCSSCRTR